MSCEAFEDMIAVTAGDDLAAPEAERLYAERLYAERLEAHLRDCEPCRQFAADMRQSRRAVASLASAPIDDNVLAAVRAGVLQEIEHSGTAKILSFPAGGWQRRLAWAAALVLALGAGLLLRSGWERPAVEGPGTTPDPTPPRVTERLPAPVPPDPASEPVAVEPSPSPTVESVGEPAPPPLEEAPVRVAAVPPVAPPAPRAAVTPAVAPAVVATAPAEPTFIKLVSEEANLVIYWQVNPPTEAAKEKTHETSAV